MSTEEAKRKFEEFSSASSTTLPEAKKRKVIEKTKSFAYVATKSIHEYKSEGETENLGTFDSERAAYLFCLKEVLEDDALDEFRTSDDLVRKLDYSDLDSIDLKDVKKIVSDFNSFSFDDADQVISFHVKRFELKSLDNFASQLQESGLRATGK